MCGSRALDIIEALCSNPVKEVHVSLLECQTTPFILFGRSLCLQQKAP